MENRLAIVIAVDGLRASALGTYGNTLFPTPHFDELASRSLVVEKLFAESPSLQEFNESAWQVLPSDSVRKWLLTDTDAVSRLSPKQFNEIVLVEGGIARHASEVKQSHTAQFFSQAVELLPAWHKDAVENAGSGLLWIHFSGLHGPWDAPLELREELIEENDPPTSDFITPPLALSARDDPDEILQYRVAYSAQVAMLDSCMAGFIHAFESMTEGSNRLVMIIGTRGFSLGEHGKVGSECGSLYSEQLHLPWLLMSRATRQPLPRVIGFARPTDIGMTLSDWLLESQSQDHNGACSLLPSLFEASTALRDRTVARSTSGQVAIRTPAWMLLQGDSTELYAKPDDQWEANNVASLCPDVVELLSRCLHSHEEGNQPLKSQFHSLWR